MERLVPISIYNYLDPIEYINAIYEYLKVNKRYFSLRSWANKMGLKEATPLSQVLKRKRALPANYVQRISEYLKLPEKDQEYFMAIVEIANSKNEEVRSFWINKAHQLYSKANFNQKILGEEEFAFFYDNLTILLMEIIELQNFKLDPKWIQNQLYFPIEASKIQSVYEDLFSKGYLIKDENGKITKTSKHITSQHDIGSIWVKKFHEIALKNATEAVYKQSEQEREFGSYILPINSEKLPEIKQRIREFTKELIASYDTTNNQADSVYQFNVNFFAQAKKEDHDHV